MGNRALWFEALNVAVLFIAGCWVLLTNLGSGGLLFTAILVGVFTVAMHSTHLREFLSNLQQVASHKQGISADNKWGA